MKILYILGRGRGGSTVLANVLGAAPWFFSAGEVRTLWDPVVSRASACACGEPVTRCPVWSRVLERLGDVDVADAARLQREIVREIHTLRLLRARSADPWRSLNEYAHLMSRVYEAVAEVTGSRVVVDSSKRPSYAAVVRVLGGCDPYFLHLVRDPRASAYSWRTRRYESAHGGEVRRRNALDATVRWGLLNLEAEALFRKVPADRRLRIRYEDFAGRPRDVVRTIMRFVGEPDVEPPFVDDRTVELVASHSIAGNPSRFETGRVVLRDAREWVDGQGRGARLTSTAVALPLLRRYGYGVRARR